MSLAVFGFDSMSKHSRNRVYWKRHLTKIALHRRFMRLQRIDLLNFLKSRPCKDCKHTFPAVCMDFDHVRGVKRGNVSEMVGRASLDAIADEVEKCDVVCANCHRKRTAARILQKR